MEYVGIDLHKKESQICLLTEAGEVMEPRIRTEPQRFAEILGGRPRARVLVEASTESEWVARCLEALGHEVVVADPNFAPMYATRTRKVKTDRRDARALQEACLLGAYRPAHRLSDAQRHVRGRLAVRDALVRTRTGYIALTRALLRRHGWRVPTGSANTFSRRVMTLPLSGRLLSEVAPLLAAMQTVTSRRRSIASRHSVDDERRPHGSGVGVDPPVWARIRDGRGTAVSAGSVAGASARQHHDSGRALTGERRNGPGAETARLASRAAPSHASRGSVSCKDQCAKLSRARASTPGLLIFRGGYAVRLTFLEGQLEHRTADDAQTSAVGQLDHLQGEGVIRHPSLRWTRASGQILPLCLGEVHHHGLALRSLELAQLCDTENGWLQRHDVSSLLNEHGLTRPQSCAVGAESVKDGTGWDPRRPGLRRRPVRARGSTGGPNPPQRWFQIGSNSPECMTRRVPSVVEERKGRILPVVGWSTQDPSR